MCGEQVGGKQHTRKSSLDRITGVVGDQNLFWTRRCVTLNRYESAFPRWLVNVVFSGFESLVPWVPIISCDRAPSDRRAIPYESAIPAYSPLWKPQSSMLETVQFLQPTLGHESLGYNVRGFFSTRLLRLIFASLKGCLKLCRCPQPRPDRAPPQRWPVSEKVGPALTKKSCCLRSLSCSPQLGNALVIDLGLISSQGAQFEPEPLSTVENPNPRLTSLDSGAVLRGPQWQLL